MAKPAVQTFGKYQILERIATGGMAEIYKARLEGIGGFQRIFAIKRILPHLSQNAEYVAMLVDEAKVAGLLSHANIVQILDLGQVDGVWYIAMEYVEGRDLGSVLKRVRQKGLCLPIPHTVFITIELLKGLEYAHQRQVMRGGRPVPLNIIHRDISPPNILMSYQGEVKLTDFGIARASHKALETQSGVIKGRFDYMSPEQAAGAKDLDQRSDLFAVGVVLYEMLTGEHPFRHESEFGTLERIRTGKYAPVSTKNPEVPFALETIVDRSLRVDRSERYPSATAFKEALDKFFHDAEFIFSHSTFAAYVRGLFPDARSGAATPGPPPPRLLDDGPETDDIELQFETEGPTRVMDQRILDEERPTQGMEPMAPFGFNKGLDEPTHVRKSPFLDADLDEAMGRSAQWADEQETLIKKLDLTPPPAAERARPAPSVERSPARPERSEVSQSRSVSPRPRGFGLLAAALVVMAGLAGLSVGTAAGFGLSRVLAGPGAAASVQAASLLRVEAPEGARVRVDGAPLDGEHALEPGRPARVVVELDGYGSWSQMVTLGSGETRVLVLTAEGLQREEP